MSGTGRMTKRCSIKHFQVWVGGKVVGVGKAERGDIAISRRQHNKGAAMGAAHIKIKSNQRGVAPRCPS